jgi:hypothetical protein
MEGVIRKMRVEQADPVRYQLVIGDGLVDLNPLLGRKVSLMYTGKIFCVACGRKTNKSFNQGHCFPCLRKLAACDTCIIKPEQCHYDAGTCREPEWGEANCMQTHVVYLANSSGPKVGITRKTQVPTRWIDQGAIQALPIFEVDTRLHSGLVEVALKTAVADKTNWRRMLQGIQPEIDMSAERKRVLEVAEPALAACLAELGDGTLRVIEEDEPMRFTYPVLRNPEKVTAHNFDKENVISGVLDGIRGQYLILDTGVLNIRKFGGYEISFEAV